MIHPLHSLGETPSALLCPFLGSLVQERYGDTRGEFIEGSLR